LVAGGTREFRRKFTPHLVDDPVRQARHKSTAGRTGFHSLLVVFLEEFLSRSAFAMPRVLLPEIKQERSVA
jgi:hypothetical protein